MSRRRWCMWLNGKEEQWRYGEEDGGEGEQNEVDSEKEEVKCQPGVRRWVQNVSIEGDYSDCIFHLGVSR